MPEKMSTSSQNNGKKSSNSSIVNTPASTPLTNTANGNAQVNSLQNSPPPNNNAPKYGTLVPNRIFVGGISANTTEGELMQLFSNYGTVKAAKIIQDRAGVSKGYGFITFESEDDAKRPLREAENIVLRERKLNIAPAIKKQPFSRTFDASSPPAVAAGNAAQFFFPPGAPVPYFQGGVAYYPQPGPPGPGDPSAQTPVYQTPPVYPAQTGPPQTATYPSMMFPTQTIYMPQQYPLPMPYEYNYFQNNGAGGPTGQYVVGSQGGTGVSQCTPIPSSSSSTRPPCYTQQMPGYNPDPIFYNLPLYGATIEGPPIYSDAFELAPVGPYTEESNNGVVENYSTTQQDVGMPVNSATHNNDHVPTSQHALTVATSTNSNNTPTPTDNHNTTNNYDDRNSSTPVVSLLSLDQQQEKDFTSLQGGKKRKPPANPLPSHPTSIPPRTYPSNGYVSHPYGTITFHHPPPPPPPPSSQTYNTYNTNVVPHHRPTYNAIYTRRSSNNVFDGRYNNNNKPKKRYEGNKSGYSNDHSSRSSLRTDSNSSASCVDENKNEEKPHSRTAVNTPPPAPYSPLANPFKIFTMPNYHNPRSSPNAKYHNYNRNSYHNNNNYYGDKFRGSTEPSGYGKSGTFTSNYSHSQHNSTSQVHVAPSQTLAASPSSQGLAGAPSNVRRNRRSIRRSMVGGGANEIGAGDAPLPGDVSAAGEVCKKLESIKL